MYASSRITSAPTLCSLDGTHLDMIVGSPDGLYRINFPDTEFDASDTINWPWPTFHVNAARTGCSTAPTTTLVSASIFGNVVNTSSQPIQGASISITAWSSSAVPGVAGRPNETRTNPVYSAGNPSITNEVNKGAFVISQLPTGTYRLTVAASGYVSRSDIQVTVTGTGGYSAGSIALQAQ